MIPKKLIAAVKISGRKIGAYKTGNTVRIRRTNAYSKDWGVISRYIKKRDNYKCVKCSSEEKLEVHHIIRLSDGGSNSPLNLITLCSKCHDKQPGHKHLKKKRGT